MRTLVAAIVIATAICAAGPPEASAQGTPSKLVEVELRDGSRLYGTVTSEDASQLVLQTISGNALTLTRAQIKRVNATVGQIVNGEFWTDDATTSKLFLGPTGRSLKRGEGYLAIDVLFLPVFQVGVTDRFSIGLGAPFYGFAKSAWITPKLQIFESERLAVSTGVLHLFVPDFGLGGYGYVVATYGTPNGAVTFGGGALYARDDDEAGTLPMFTIGGERRVTRRVKLVTENYVFQEGVIATGGARIIGQIFSFEFGALVPIADGDAFPGVFFNFVFHSRPKAGR